MKIRIMVLSAAIAAFGVLGFASPAGAAPCKNVLSCVDAVICLAGSQAGLQCVD
jgi:hypothetical protein